MNCVNYVLLVCKGVLHLRTTGAGIDEIPETRNQVGVDHMAAILDYTNTTKIMMHENFNYRLFRNFIHTKASLSEVV